MYSFPHASGLDGTQSTLGAGGWSPIYVETDRLRHRGSSASRVRNPTRSWASVGHPRATGRPFRAPPPSASPILTRPRPPHIVSSGAQTCGMAPPYLWSCG